MKKKYIMPEFNLVNLDTRDIIATSTLGIGTGGGSGSAGARGTDFMDWDDEDW